MKPTGPDQARSPTRRCWALLRGGMGAEDVLVSEEAMLQGMRLDFEALERVQVGCM